jgi:ATP12 chaperone protein
MNFSLLPLLSSPFIRGLRPNPTLLRLARGNSTAFASGSTPITETNRTVLFPPFILQPSHSNYHCTGAETTRKRFWKTVGIDRRGDEFTVTLDDRPLKTPSGNVLLLPPNKHLVASLIAAEWEQQEVLLKPHALPMVSYPFFPMLRAGCNASYKDFPCLESCRCTC